MEVQQVNAHEQVSHHQRHGGRKKGHHLMVRGHRGGCGGDRHGHKCHGKQGYGGHRKVHGNRHVLGHGFVIVEEQSENGGQIIVAHASGGDQPQPESSEGEIPHHHHHHHHGCHRRRHRFSHHHAYLHHRGQVTEAVGGAPNELSGAIVSMVLADEPKE